MQNKNSKSKIILFVLFAAAASAPASFSKELDDISPTLAGIVQKYDLPSLVGAVIVDGDVRATGVAGVRKAGTDVKALFSDTYHLGSCTKSMTSTLIAMLIEEGKLRWDSTLLEIFPEYSDTMNPVYKNVTLEMLMTMRAGFPRDVLPAGLEVGDYFEFPGDTILEQRYNYAGLILSSTESSQPGTAFLYSNAGYVTLGAVIEKVTGKSWEDFIQERIFTPLGMTSAGIGTYGSADQVDAPWWHVFSDEGQREAYAPTAKNDIPPVYAPAGLVHSTMNDWIKYITIHLKGENEDQILLKRETIKRLHTPAFANNNYACGWVQYTPSWGGGPYLFHNGSNGANLSNAWLSPKTGFAVLIITNQYSEATETGVAEAVEILMKRYSPASGVDRWSEMK